MDITLIQASELDSETLANISKRAFETDIDYGGTGVNGPPGYDSPAFYTRILRFMSSYCIMLNDNIVGGIMANIRGKHGVIERVFVDPDHMCKGIGSTAMNQIFSNHREVTLWTLGTPEWNIRAKPFYEKLGFRQVGWDYSEPTFRGRWYEKKIGEESAFTPIKSLKDGLSNLLIEGEVVEKSQPRMVKSKKTGEALTVGNAAIKDDSGRVVMVIWGEQLKLVKVGDRIRVEGGYTNNYLDILQLNVGYGRLIILI